MSAPIANSTPPDLRALLDGFRQEVLSALNCHLLGKIVSFDHLKQTASVQVQSLKTLPDGSQVAYPLLTDCPVYFPSGGGAILTFPVSAGDNCLVMFHDVDLDTWFQTGNVVVPNTARSHSLSDGLVLLGFNSLASPISPFQSTHFELKYAGGTIHIDETGQAFVQSAGGSYFGAYNGEVAIANIGGVYIGGVTKVNIQNTSGTLKAALDSLATLLTAWTNTGGSTPNAATLTAITAFKTAVDNLLA